MFAQMRAKFVINSIERHGTAEWPSETLKMSAVPKLDKYPDDGFDEDNTYAKFTPSASLSMSITNKALVGRFNSGEKFYVDFTPVG